MAKTTHFSRTGCEWQIFTARRRHLIVFLLSCRGNPPQNSSDESWQNLPPIWAIFKPVLAKLAWGCGGYVCINVRLVRQWHASKGKRPRHASPVTWQTRGGKYFTRDTHLREIFQGRGTPPSMRWQVTWRWGVGLELTSPALLNAWTMNFLVTFPGEKYKNSHLGLCGSEGGNWACVLFVWLRIQFTESRINYVGF